MARSFSRRAVLSSSLVAAVGLAGCGTPLTPAFQHRYTSYRDEPLVTEASELSNDGFYSTVLTSSDGAATIEWSALPEPTRGEFDDVDYDESFVAIFLSRRALTPPGAADGDRPRTTVEGDTFVFEFQGSKSPPPIEDGDVLTVIERWTVGVSPPSTSEIRRLNKTSE